MAEPLKNIYSQELVERLAKSFKSHYPAFNAEAFIQSVLADDWQTLELKQRMRRIAQTLGDFLPEDYPAAINILLAAAQKYTGMQHMFFADFVELFGLEHFDVSMQALAKLTCGSTAEFAIRPFIINQPKKTMSQMAKWSRSNNEHIRRLSSEGCRPRLPWAMALPEYKQDPTEVLLIILPLMDDESLYVRRSVANNLNDISKDHPQLILKIAEEHFAQSANKNWVIKHACRGLLKQGEQQILKLLGFNGAKHVELKDFEVDNTVALGDKLNFSCKFFSSKQPLGNLRVEFIIDFKKANGKNSPKIFKICEGNYQQSAKTINKYFSFKAISTRKYYLGEHLLSIVINGNNIASKLFELIAK